MSWFDVVERAHVREKRRAARERRRALRDAATREPIADPAPTDFSTHGRTVKIDGSIIDTDWKLTVETGAFNEAIDKASRAIEAFGRAGAEMQRMMEGANRKIADSFGVDPRLISSEQPYVSVGPSGCEQCGAVVRPEFRLCVTCALSETRPATLDEHLLVYPTHRIDMTTGHYFACRDCPWKGEP